MQFAGIQVRRRIFVGLGLLLVGTGIWFFWSRATLPGVKETKVRAEAFVKIVGPEGGLGGRTMEERAEFFDPTPLFLPSARSFHQGELPARVVRQPGQVFVDFPPKLNFAETALPDYGLEGQEGVAGLAEVLANGNQDSLAGFGHVDRGAPSLSRRDGFLEVKQLKDGALSIAESIVIKGLKLAEFSPVEYVITVVATGLAGDPMLLVSSGREEVDLALRDFLTNEYRIGSRLAPGRYQVVIGP